MLIPILRLILSTLQSGNNLKDIVILHDLIEDLRKNGYDQEADRIEQKTLDLYLSRLPKEKKNGKNQHQESN